MSSYVEFKPTEHPTKWIINTIPYINQDDSSDMKYINDIESSTEVSKLRTIAFIVLSLKDMYKQFEKLKNGYFHGAEIINSQNIKN